MAVRFRRRIRHSTARVGLLRWAFCVQRYDQAVPARPRPEPSLVPAAAVLDRLLRHYPTPDTELAYRNAFELLIATVLSAQSTDKRVNETTPALFAQYPDAQALGAAEAADIEPIIHATGFFRVKAKAIVTLSQRLVNEHRGEVPATMEALVALPGVGRKTANVVLGHALGVPGLPVDRHVLRVTERIGLTFETTPEGVEQGLCAALDPSDWTRMSDGLILHGRRICRPKPLCGECHVADICRYRFKTAGLPRLDLAAPVKRSKPKAASPRAADRRTSPATAKGHGPTLKAGAAKPSKADGRRPKDDGRMGRGAK